VRTEDILTSLRFDVEAYVIEMGGQPETKREYALRCPRCSKEKLFVNVEKRRWRCFLCEQYMIDARGKKVAVEGTGGVAALVMWLEGIDRSAAAERMRAFAQEQEGSPDELPPMGGPRQLAVTALCPTGLPEGCEAITRMHPYMERRGITLHDAQTFGLGIVWHGWLANRLVFPVWERGKCLYWQARAMWDEHEHVGADKYRKTLNPKREHKGQFFFGSGDVVLNIDQASKYPRVAITEGPTSMVRVGPSAVATFGKQLQPNQIAKFVEYGVRSVDFMWDGPSKKEPNGTWDNAVIAAAQLAVFVPDVRIVRIPVGDPGDYTRAEIERMRQAAIPVATSPLW